MPKKFYNDEDNQISSGTIVAVIVEICVVLTMLALILIGGYYLRKQ